jgi:endoribonuclease LACTB2
MCRHEHHIACAQTAPSPRRTQSGRYSGIRISPTSANVSPGSGALAPRSDVKRNVIPKNLERFTEGPLPKQLEVEKLSDRVICILGKNPSAFTLNGTNMYLIGTGKRRTLLDAGEGSPKAEQVISTLEVLFAKEGVEGLDEIVITHLHHDHVGGASHLAKRFGPCRMSKFPSPKTEIERRKEVIRLEQERAGIDPASHVIPASAAITHIGLDFEVNSGYHRLSEGELLRTEGASLRVFWTPGHAPDHVVVLLEEERSLFSGDHVLGWGTSWVDDLGLYMQSLHKIRLLNPARLYP